MILVSPPYRTNWGCLLADSGTIRREVTRPVAGRPSMFRIYVRCVSTPEILADVSVNIVEPSGKAIDNTQGRASRLSSSGVPFAGLQPVPAAATGAAIQPRSKRMTRPCASRTSALELSPWAMPAHAVGNPGRPGRADVAPPRPFVDRSYVPCAGSATAPAISGALSTRPQRRRRRWPIQRSELLPSRDALRACSNRARRTPRSWRGLPPRGRQRWGSVHSGDEGPLVFPESRPCAHTGAVHGACGSGSPTRSAGVSMDAK